MTLLVEAVRSSGCSEKEVSIALGCPDQPYWNKVKNRDKPCPRITKVTDVPIPVQRDMVKRWGRQLGMHVSDDDARKRALAEAACALTNALREIV